MVHVEKSRLTPETSEVGIGYHWHDHGNVIATDSTSLTTKEADDMIQLNDNGLDGRIEMLVVDTARPVRETHG